MNKEEMICKNCKCHYIEDISFDYPQSCCSKRQCTTEQWCKCSSFEYGDRYIEQLQQENKKYKEVIDKAIKLLGNYRHYSTPDEKQNSDNEDLVNKAFDILKKVMKY